MLKPDKLGDIQSIVISGWYGAGNVGDEAILVALAQRYRDCYPKAKIIALSLNPELSRKVCRVEAVHQLPFGIRSWINFFLKFYFIKTLWVIFRCDVFVMGGGGFLSDWQANTLPRWLRQLKFAKWLGKKVLLDGVGVGPINTKKGEKLLKKYLDRYVDFISVRDNISYRVLKNQVQIEGNVSVVVDPVATMDVDSIFSYSTKSFGYEQYILLVYCEFFSHKAFCSYVRFSDKLLSCYCAQIDFLLEQGKALVIGFMHSQHDLPLIEFLSHKYKNQLEIEIYSDIEQCTQSIKKAQAVISFRLHGNILAYALNRPFLPICYHNKCVGFLEMVKFPTDEAILIGDGTRWYEHGLQEKYWIQKTNEFLKRRL